MGILNKRLKEKHAKLRVVPPGSVTGAVGCPTGYTLIDAHTSVICLDKNGEEFLSSGFPFGKIITFIGNSQSGKTTLAEQIAYNMVAHLNGDIAILDYERSSANLIARFTKINNCTREEFKDLVSVYNHTGMSTEFLKKFIFDVVEMKKELSKDDMIDWKNEDGEDIKIYPPTIIIVDSIPAMKPEEVLKNPDLDNNMVPSKMAAANSALFKTVLDILETYNITLFTINHITTKIITNAYAPRKVIIPGLGEDENLPGGNSCSFLPSFIVRLTSGAELKAEKDMCDGRVTDLRLLKTRLGFNNTRLKFILEKTRGMHDGLTLFYYAKENKLLTGGGPSGFTFNGNPSSKFTQKKFLGMYEGDEAFRNAFEAMVQDHLLSTLSFQTSCEQVNVNVDDLDDEFDDDE